MRNIFVLGLDDFHRALLERLPDADSLAVHGLLDYAAVARPGDSGIDLEGLLAAAERELDAFEGSVDAVISHWDFPGAVLSHVLKRRRGLPGPSLESVAAFEHKYWSRVEQARVLPGMVPRFRAFDPFADDPFARLDLPFPYWIKPVKAHSSYLGFKIHDADDAAAALPAIRRNIDHFAVPFDQFLAMVDVPEAIRPIGGRHMIAEEIISAGHQCTLEGYAAGEDVRVYGTVDSARAGRHNSSFARYQYPSRLPERVRARMAAAAATLVRAVGYRDAPFNMEFYWDEATDGIHVLEVNTRISKSHSPLFAMVDGQSHHRVAIDIALGRHPDFPQGRGPFPLAAKFMLRTFEAGRVRRVPTAEDRARLAERFPEVLVRVLVEPGTVLARMPYQDSYSYEIAEIFLGGRSETELLAKHEEALAMLPFDIEHTDRAA